MTPPGSCLHPPSPCYDVLDRTRDWCASVIYMSCRSLMVVGRFVSLKLTHMWYSASDEARGSVNWSVCLLWRLRRRWTDECAVHDPFHYSEHVVLHCSDQSGAVPAMVILPTQHWPYLLGQYITACPCPPPLTVWTLCVTRWRGGYNISLTVTPRGCGCVQGWPI